MRIVALATPWTPPADGPEWSGGEFEGIVWPGGRGWQSNGGNGRGHPARRLPNRLALELPDGLARVTSVEMVGVFALYAGSTEEPPGSLGASVALESAGRVVERWSLVNARHYRDARSAVPLARNIGDGVRLAHLGEVDLEGRSVSLDRLEFTLANPGPVDRLEFRDLGTPASFVVFGAMVHGEPAGCPFATRRDAVSLGDVPGIVRLGDRQRLRRATEEMAAGLRRCGDDLEEARSLALTFLAVVLAGLVERGEDRRWHRALGEAVRELERETDLEGLVAAAVGEVERWTATPGAAPAHDRLMERALAVLDRQFARDLNDAQLARQLGLSTSHFRHLFRQATGLPFHRYLMGLRLERARELLNDPSWSVAEVASQVGFQSAAHFSRAYSARFGTPPSGRRRTT